MRTLLALVLSLAAPAWAAPDVPTLAGASATLLGHRGAQVTLELPTTADHVPGDRVGVYVAEGRPDPRSGATVQGLRYAGDARVVWVGADLVQLELVWPDQPFDKGTRAILGAPRSASPTPPAQGRPVSPFEPTDPLPTAENPPEAEVSREQNAATSEQGPEAERSLADEKGKRDGPERVRVNGAWRGRYGSSHALTSAVDWADHGHQTGVGLASVGWGFVPERGVGRVAVRLEGLRGSRWVAAEGAGRRESEAREAAVGYWLWSTVEGTAVSLAPRVGLAVGVQQSGPTGGLELGLRSGLPHAGHITLDYAVYGALGTRWTLAGAVPLSDRVRLGTRARVGALPLHQPPPVRIAVVGAEPAWKQQRADGSLRLTWDLTDQLTTTTGAGLAAYDLVLADAGPVLDLALELRW